MTGNHDVAARLADAHLALDDFQTYAAAARPRSHADLETWYGAERGLDLQRLDADRATLEAAAHSATDALAAARRQLTALAAAWDGPGAAAAAGFLRRHCDSAAVLVDSLLTAAAACTELRDELWRSVDAKVTATTTLAERVGAHRETWLSAAQLVLAGTPDEAAAAVVADQVAPFVDTAIGAEWLRDMQTTTDAARRAYREAVARLGEWPTARFEVPGDLGPAFVAEAPRGRPPEVSPGWMADAPLLPPSGPESPPGQANAPLPAPVATPPAGVPPLTPPDLSAASAIPGRVGEALDGLLGSPGTPPLGPTGPTEPTKPVGLPGLEPPTLDGPEEPEEVTEDEDAEGEDAEGEDEAAEEQAPEEQAPEDPGPDAAPEGQPQQDPPEITAGTTELDSDSPAPARAPAAEPAPVPDCGAAAPVPSPPSAVTPCEMAADELPQVGQ